MIDNIEELKKMCDILNTKLAYFTRIDNKSSIKALKKNLKKVEDRIEEILKEDITNQH